MATVRPFRALRPRPERAAEVCELPYDVMSLPEARRMAEGRPHSFLRVSRPDIELPDEADAHGDAAYAGARRALERLQAEGALVRERQPCLFVYRLTMGAHSQTGIAAVFSCREYLDGVVRRHELTRPDKEDDRVRHIDACGAQTGPALLTYRQSADLDALVREAVSRPAEVDFVAGDGIRHVTWAVRDPDWMGRVGEAFRAVPRLYIADGHHRSAAAARVCGLRHGAGESDHFLAVVFPHNQLRILPYHRVVRDLQGRSAADFLACLGRLGVLEQARSPVAPGPGSVSLYLEGRWHWLRFAEALMAESAEVDRLDVAVLQRHVLGPLLGIEDPRRSERIGFVGGIRGAGELERLVEGGGYACAFGMHPTGIAQLLRVADAGEIMPPKSTWFEPKLRDGLFSHVLEPS